jgi:hypothetical protein
MTMCKGSRTSLRSSADRPTHEPRGRSLRPLGSGRARRRRSDPQAKRPDAAVLFQGDARARRYCEPYAVCSRAAQVAGRPQCGEGGTFPRCGAGAQVQGSLERGLWCGIGNFFGDHLVPFFMEHLARPKRFELLTPRFVVWCSIQLSYGRVALWRVSRATRGTFRAENGRKAPIYRVRLRKARLQHDPG